jgi:AcrR family transcriptional regulator
MQRYLTVLGNTNVSRVAKRREGTRQEILEAAWATAREQGVGALTLRAVATRVGMQTPSLYSHFSSKNAIYDAMYGQAWQEFVDMVAQRRVPGDPRAALREIATTFFDFAVADLARYQLMNQRSVPGFEPSEESYAPAVKGLEQLRTELAKIGIGDQAGLDIFTALVGGMVDQQLANDPGGTRWRRLLGRVIDMYANEMGLPPSTSRRRR